MKNRRISNPHTDIPAANIQKNGYIEVYWIFLTLYLVFIRATLRYFIIGALCRSGFGLLFLFLFIFLASIVGGIKTGALKDETRSCANQPLQGPLTNRAFV